MRAKTIRALRTERGWTQFDLALAVGVRPQTVYFWESGRRQPQVSQMRKLGAVFGICSDDIELNTAPGDYVLATGQPPSDHQESEATSGQEQSGEGRYRVSGP
jgi:DNA-binding XRE family transcriptional regulator